jgi:hypothetical protein
MRVYDIRGHTLTFTKSRPFSRYDHLIYAAIANWHNPTRNISSPFTQSKQAYQFSWELRWRESRQDSNWNWGGSCKRKLDFFIPHSKIWDFIFIQANQSTLRPLKRLIVAYLKILPPQSPSWSLARWQLQFHW